MNVHQLRTELNMRGVPTQGKKKEKNLDDLRRGITNVPALLQGVPAKPLHEFGLEHYEISPVEPLHDIKGHLSNIIEKLRVSLSGEVKQKVEEICSAVLAKDTLRGSDYRKGAILMLHCLEKLQPSSSLTALLQTAVELTEILYSDPAKRTPQSVLRLHNVAFVHAKLCVDTFRNPKTISLRKMFGRHFHALTTHAPLQYRIIALRQLNTEFEERIFGTCKSITKTTSSQHTSHVITNFLIRIHCEEEQNGTSMGTLETQESEVLKLAKH